MALRRSATELCISIDSRPEHLPRLRTVVGCLAADLGMSSEEAQDTKLAITEACANAIRHGSPDGAGSGVTIKLVAGRGGMLAEVTDHGDGFDVNAITVPAPAERAGGMGIPLMRALSDRVEFLRNAKGMTVRLVKKVKGRITRRGVASVRNKRQRI
ncbi:MAG: ATP-binding protein [Armatimonadota bacterium]|nr:ATP-binding protein [Armatimonadota bacterium]